MPGEAWDQEKAARRPVAPAEGFGDGPKDSRSALKSTPPDGKASEWARKRDDSHPQEANSCKKHESHLKWDDYFATEYGDFSVEDGNSATEYGDSTAEYGNSAAEYGNSAAEYGNSATEYGDSAAEYGNSTTE